MALQTTGRSLLTPGIVTLRYLGRGLQELGWIVLGWPPLAAQGQPAAQPAPAAPSAAAADTERAA